MKTEKQVISGYHRPVCVKCNCELHPEKNGIGVLDMTEFGPYELYAADMWKCPKCRIEVAGGFAYNPMSTHHKPNFQSMIEAYEKEGLLIKNSG